MPPRIVFTIVPKSIVTRTSFDTMVSATAGPARRALTTLGGVSSMIRS